MALIGKECSWSGFERTTGRLGDQDGLWFCVEREYGIRIGAWARENVVLAHSQKNLLAVSGRSLKRAATHSGTVFVAVSQNDVFSCPGAYSDAIFAFYAKNRSSGAFGLSIGVEEDPMCGEALHLGYQQPARPLGGALASRAQCAICPDL